MRGGPNPDLRAAAVLAVVCAALALAVPFEVVRLAFAAPLVLFLPGFAISCATFVGRPLSRAQLLLTSIGISLMTIALAGILLNLLPGRFGALSWAALAVLVVLLAGRIAVHRRAAAGYGPRRLRFAVPGVRPRHALLGCVGAAAAVAALILAFATLPAKNAIGYSELWMLPLDDGTGVRVGIGSQEQEPVDYRLRVAFGRGDSVYERRLSLKPGEEREIDLPTHPNATGNPVRVNAALFRQDQPGEIYRRVAGFVTGKRNKR